MGTVVRARENLISALDRLNESIEHLEELKIVGKERASILMDNRSLERSLRDSSIQRFEFCVDLFWKFLKEYTEEVLGLIPEANAPRCVITTACKARIVSETDTEALLEMIRDRNFTSHIYREEIADLISAKIPGYYMIMRKYMETLKSCDRNHDFTHQD